MKSIIESIIGRKGGSLPEGIVRVPGRISWRVSCEALLPGRFRITSGQWHIMTNGGVVLFWAPDVDWYPYFFKSEYDLIGEKAWALTGPDEKSMYGKSPEEAYNIIMRDFDVYLSNAANVPEMVMVEYPDIIRQYIQYIKRSL